MLRIIEDFGINPVSVYVDPKIKFQPGQIGSLKLKNNHHTLNICDGLNPYGIIDDIRSNSIRRIVINRDSGLFSDAGMLANQMLTAGVMNLDHQNIIKSSFKCNINVDLNNKIGRINFTKSEISKVDRLIVSYAYNDFRERNNNSIINDRATVWTNKMIVETDMFDIKSEYKEYSTLYSTNGFISSRNDGGLYKPLGIVLRGPTSDNTSIRFLFDPKW